MAASSHSTRSLVRSAGAERHRPGAVEQEPRGELAILHEVPDEQLVHPGGDVPVDVADVVAPLVGAQVEEVGAVAAQQRPVVALQAPVEAPEHLPLRDGAATRSGVEQGGGVHGRSRALAARGAQHDVGDRDPAQDRVDDVLRRRRRRPSAS